MIRNEIKTPIADFLNNLMEIQISLFFGRQKIWKDLTEREKLEKRLQEQEICIKGNRRAQLIPGDRLG